MKYTLEYHIKTPFCDKCYLIISDYVEKMEVLLLKSPEIKKYMKSLELQTLVL